MRSGCDRLWLRLAARAAQRGRNNPVHRQALWPTTLWRRPRKRAGTGHEAQVEAVRDALLSAQVPGAIVAVQVQAGDAVKKGQPLLKIDGRMAQQGAVASQAQVSAAQAQLHVARKEYERQQQLFAKRCISQAALDSAQGPMAGRPGASQSIAGPGRCGGHAIGLAHHHGPV